VKGVAVSVKDPNGRHQKPRAALSKVMSNASQRIRIADPTITQLFRKFVPKSCEGMSIRKDWGLSGTFEGQPASFSKGVLSFEKENFELVEQTSPDNSTLVFGKPHVDGGNVFVAYLASSKKRHENSHMLPEARSTFQAGFQRKPNVPRGEKAGASTEVYNNYGARKDPLGTNIGQYAFKPNSKKPHPISDKEILSGIAKVTSCVEAITMEMGNRLPEVVVLEWMQQSEGVPTAFGQKGRATQVSVGKNYWSVIHLDDDYYYTTLSVLAEDGRDDLAILYYFVFPEYNIAIPLRSGDVLLFNPRVAHCCTNPSKDGAMVFSAYMSAKTPNAAMANKNCQRN